MHINQLRPANTLARQYGVKAVLYGGPGSGKTPLLNTAPRPVLCVVEPGMLSMRTSNIPCWEAYTADKIKEFIDWSTQSAEARNFDTIAIDSISQAAEVVLVKTLAKFSHGLKAYGEMSEEILEHMNKLFYLPQKHIVLLAKQGEDSHGVKRPYFPGKDLNVKVPHMYDEILHLGIHNVPGMGNTRAIRTANDFQYMARDRSGRLAELEEPNLEKLFIKAMS